jgi:hypothetical protein
VELVSAIPGWSKAAALGRAALEAATAQRDANVLPIVREIEAAGITSRNAICGRVTAAAFAPRVGARGRMFKLGCFSIVDSGAAA